MCVCGQTERERERESQADRQTKTSNQTERYIESETIKVLA